MTGLSDIRVISARWRVHPLLLAAFTILVSVATAAVFARLNGRNTTELPAFALWSIPLALIVAWFARRPRFERLPKAARVVAGAFFGLAVGVATTFTIYTVTGGAVMAFDFPVLYCWTPAAIAGVLAAMVAQQSFSMLWGAFGMVLAILPLVLLDRMNSLPQPAVIITYRGESAKTERAADFIYDSVLTFRQPSRQDHDFRWPVHQYQRGMSSDCHATALLILKQPGDSAAIRRALKRNPRVLSVRDTLISYDPRRFEITPPKTSCPP